MDYQSNNRYNLGCKFRNEVGEAPLRILRQKTRQILSTKLDSRKLILTDTMLHRDWRGLAEKADIDSSIIRSSKISFTEHCLHLWGQKGATILNFLDAMESIDRYDVIDDTLDLIYNDFDYAMSKDVLKLRPIPPSFEEGQSTIADFDSNVLTTDDQKNLIDGGSLQFYDALVLFADQDLDFVDEMVQKLEGEYNLKLCLRDRDLVGGLAFEFSAVMRLIEERCARVIVVLSPAFLQSAANKFLAQFAHALSIDKKRRIVIPCMYKPCEKPPEIAYCFSLDYFRTRGYWDYWKKLADSIISTQSTIRNSIAPVSSPTIRELPSPSFSPISLSSSTSTRVVQPQGAERFPLNIPQTVLSRIRGITGDRTEKVNSRGNENRQESKTSPGKVEKSLNGSELCVSLPPSSPTTEASECDSRSEYSSESKSPTSPTFSTAPLLEFEKSSTREGINIKNRIKKIFKFTKKKEVAIMQ